MAEEWVEAGIWFRNEVALRDIVLGITKPIASRLRGEDWVRSFHYFFEDDPHLLFRVEVGDDERVDVAKDLVKKVLDEDARQIIDEFDVDRPYAGEAESYGENGWNIAKRVFELGSRMAISLFDEKFDRGKSFQQTKLIHCFLNPQGVQEADFHLDTFIGRVLIESGKTKLDQVAREAIERQFARALEERGNRELELI